MSEETKQEPLFERLSKIDVNKFTEKKNGLTYPSWAHAWRLFKQHAPDATYEIVKAESGSVCHPCGTGLTIYTKVSAEGETHEMWLPVLDFRNQSIPRADADSFQINKTVMRCLVKNLAMFGLGIYIYAGEDLPESDDKPATVATPAPQPAAKKRPSKPHPLPNVGVEKWEDWKVKGDTTMGMIVEAADETKEDKIEKFEKSLEFYKSKAEEAETEERAAYFFKGESFARRAISELEKQPV
jgi:hypothetical protein